MKSKYYYDYKRNVDVKHATKEDLDKINKNLFNKKAKDKLRGKIPNYYIGSVYGYEARRVIEDWNLSYNVGNAVTYLLRAGKKKEKGMTDKEKHIDDLKKAINHLEFEIEKINNK
jgi:hypothetical protein